MLFDEAANSRTSGFIVMKISCNSAISKGLADANALSNSAASTFPWDKMNRMSPISCGSFRIIFVSIPCRWPKHPQVLEFASFNFYNLVEPVWSKRDLLVCE
jgi:hypothetical protein